MLTSVTIMFNLIKLSKSNRIWYSASGIDLFIWHNNTDEIRNMLVANQLTTSNYTDIFDNNPWHTCHIVFQDSGRTLILNMILEKYALYAEDVRADFASYSASSLLMFSCAPRLTKFEIHLYLAAQDGLPLCYKSKLNHLLADILKEP